MVTPVRPVVPVLRSPDGIDHQVRVDGRACCRARVNPDTWRVVAEWQARDRCGLCARETA